jgi:hypothetical protein
VWSFLLTLFVHLLPFVHFDIFFCFVLFCFALFCFALFCFVFFLGSPVAVNSMLMFSRQLTKVLAMLATNSRGSINLTSILKRASITKSDKIKMVELQTQVGGKDIAKTLQVLQGIEHGRQMALENGQSSAIVDVDGEKSQLPSQVNPNDDPDMSPHPLPFSDVVTKWQYDHNEDKEDEEDEEEGEATGAKMPTFDDARDDATADKSVMVSDELLDDSDDEDQFRTRNRPVYPGKP